MTNTMTRKFAVIAALLIAMVALSACGNKNTNPDPNPVNNNVNTGPVAPAKRSVVLYNYRFNPATLTVPAGTVVTFTNRDPVQHNINIAGMNVDRNLPNGASFSVTFSRRGQFAVSNRLANNPMRGTIIVQ